MSAALRLSAGEKGAQTTVYEAGAFHSCGAGGLPYYLSAGLPELHAAIQGKERELAAQNVAARLRRQVMEALEGWQLYRHLARRARGTEARVLNTLAGELHRCARKLSAAYFLVTGLRYWPSELLSAPAIPSYWGALRRRHQLEQQQETAFRMAADDWDTQDMLDLYGELAEGCQRRCRQLRALLEQDLI